ncbi:MAG: SDR family oxidoreductase, partial [Bacteroidales bacterium]|nr:SDR family oxidoreductase [Bacteroidales bacterium]
MDKHLVEPQPQEPFTSRHALIFGGAKGIGGAAAREFARRGATVAIADIDEAAGAETAAAIRAAGGTALALACDVTCDESMLTAVAEAERRFGDIDIVMNNVGVILSGNPEDIPFAEWQRILDLNLFPVVRSNGIFLPKMIARRTGHIVNTASFAGLYPYAANRMPYVASKAAVVALTESLALYLLPQG